MIDDFLEVLSGIVERDILAKVRASPAVGILCDESTDVSNLKQLVVYVRFLVEAKPRCCFLKIADLFDGKSETIEQKLVEVCSESEISISLVFSFGSDGASVMTGRKAGVAARLKAHNPEMISIHCGAHRVALASSQAATSVAYLKTFDSHLTTLYYHFANSAVREASLHEVQAVMGEAVLRLKKAIHTRWLSHDQAVMAIRRTLSSLIVTLEREVAEKDDAVARGLVKAMNSHQFVATIYLLSDVLPHLTTLSLVFQRQAVDLSLVQPQVSATIASIKFLRSKPGPILNQLDNTLTELSSNFGLKVTEEMKTHFQVSIREPYIDKLVENLQDRFRDSDLLAALVTLFDSTKASRFHTDSGSSFDSYGTTELDCKLPYNSDLRETTTGVVRVQAPAYQ